LRETDLEGNRGRTDLWLLDLTRSGAEPVKIASDTEHNEHDPRFSGDGRWLYYLSNASGTDQLWRVELSGGTPERVSDLAADISGFLPAPTGDRIAIWADRDMACTDFNCANVTAPGRDTAAAGSMTRPSSVTGIPGRSLACARAFSHSRLSTAGRRARARRSRRGWSAIHRPSRSAAPRMLAWGADGRTLYFTLAEGGRTEPNSTNLDIYAVPADGSAAPANLTDANDATDNTPAISPTGRWLAYAAMARPTYEADRQVVQLRNLETGETRALTGDWDRSVGSIAWAPDGRSLLVTAGDTLDTPLFRVDISNGR
jgi:Tol biopolymer transport system component